MNKAFRILALISIVCVAASCERTGFKVKGGRAVYVTWNEGDGTVVREVDGADPKTFELIPNPTANHFFYAKDASHVYMSGPLHIDGADPATFTILDEK